MPANQRTDLSAASARVDIFAFSTHVLCTTEKQKIVLQDPAALGHHLTGRLNYHYISAFTVHLYLMRRLSRSTQEGKEVSNYLRCPSQCLQMTEVRWRSAGS